MATIGGDRDRLLRAFLQNAKRGKRKPGRVNVTTPRPGQGENTTYSRASAARGTPPIPVFGQFKQQYDENSRKSLRQIRRRHKPRLSGGGGPGKTTYN